jgi:hypothetical protein
MLDVSSFTARTAAAAADLDKANAVVETLQTAEARARKAVAEAKSAAEKATAALAEGGEDRDGAFNKASDKIAAAEARLRVTGDRLPGARETARLAQEAADLAEAAETDAKYRSQVIERLLPVIHDVAEDLAKTSHGLQRLAAVRDELHREFPGPDRAIFPLRLNGGILQDTLRKTIPPELRELVRAIFELMGPVSEHPAYAHDPSALAALERFISEPSPPALPPPPREPRRDPGPSRMTGSAAQPF